MARDTERSNSALTTPELYRQSDRLFSDVAKLNPKELWEQYRFQSLNAALEQSNDSDTFDSSVEALVRDGFDSIQKTVQGVLVASLFEGTVEQRIALATHARSIATLGVLAARKEDIMNDMIGNVMTGAGNTVQLASNGEHLEMSAGTRGAAHLGTEKRCPFAGLYIDGEPVQSASPVFQNFSRWAAELAVYYDDPSYVKRHAS